MSYLNYVKVKQGATGHTVISKTPIPHMAGGTPESYGGFLVGESMHPEVAAHVVECWNAASEMFTLKQQILDVLQRAAEGAAYAAYNMNGMTLANLDPGVVESTDPEKTLLIEERSLRAMIKQLMGE